MIALKKMKKQTFLLTQHLYNSRFVHYSRNNSSALFPGNSWHQP
jgi:hypothetical protein